MQNRDVYIYNYIYNYYYIYTDHANSWCTRKLRCVGVTLGVSVGGGIAVDCKYVWFK